MGLIKTKDGRNISVASVNGYTVEKVRRAKEYIKEIGGNRRNFPVERLVEMYNDIKGTREKAVGCKPCQANKYYMGLQNYVTYGEITLINNGKATKEDLDIEKKVEENVEEKVEMPIIVEVNEEGEEVKPVKKAGRPRKVVDEEVKD